MGCIFTNQRPHPNPEIDAETKIAVTHSWPIFMENGGDYGMDVFLIAIEEHSEELRSYFEILENTENEIREHPNVMSYTTLMVHWLDDVVNNIDDKAEYKKLLKTIAHKHKLMNLPTRTTVLYKDGMITFLEKRALFNKDELDKWRIFLNKTLDRFQHDYNVAQK